MLRVGDCAEGPVPAAGLVRAGEMSQAAACILFWHSVGAGPGKGLSQPLEAPGEELTCLGTSPATCAPPARTVPKLASYSVPLTSPLAQHHLQGGIAWAVPMLPPLLVSLLHAAMAWGRESGESLLPAGSWWGVMGRAQHSLLTDARCPWEPTPMVPPLDTRQGSGAGSAFHPHVFSSAQQ